MAEPKPSPDTPESWSVASRGYAEYVAPYLMRSFSEELVRRLGIDGAASVLEVGAGSGALTEVLAREAGSVLATDFAPGMIDVLRERMAAQGVGNVRCEVMDGQQLALEDNSFDAGASAFAIMLFPDRARGFSELCRVVRPGGPVIVSGWGGPDRFELFGLLLTALRGAFPEIPPPPTPPPVFSLADPQTFRAEMEAAGFQGVHVEMVSRELVVSGIDQLWQMMTVGAPPVQVLLNQVGAMGQERLRDALSRVILERFGDGPITTYNTATVAFGRAT